MISIIQANVKRNTFSIFYILEELTSHKLLFLLLIREMREMAIEALSERLDGLMLSEDSDDETEDYDELPRPSLSRRPRRLTRGRHVDIRSFLTAGQSM